MKRALRILGELLNGSLFIAALIAGLTFFGIAGGAL